MAGGVPDLATCALVVAVVFALAFRYRHTPPEKQRWVGKTEQTLTDPQFDGHGIVV